jgi:hypothetical protein
MLRRRTTCGWLSGRERVLLLRLLQELVVLLCRCGLDFLGRDEAGQARAVGHDDTVGARQTRQHQRRAAGEQCRVEAPARVQRAGAACRVSPQPGVGPEVGMGIEVDVHGVWAPGKDVATGVPCSKFGAAPTPSIVDHGGVGVDLQRLHRRAQPGEHEQRRQCITVDSTKNDGQPIVSAMTPASGPTQTRPTDANADSSANCVAVKRGCTGS